MAGNSVKKQVANNIKLLQQTYIITGAIYSISLISRFIFGRPETNKAFYLTSIPLFICLFILEKTGRPLIEPKTQKIIKEGENLSQPGGLVEGLFDVIYLTLALHLLSVIIGSNIIFWLYSVIPGFSGYKLYGLFKSAKAMLGGGAGSTNASTSNAPQEPVKSKRQQKMEARGDKPKMRYR